MTLTKPHTNFQKISRPLRSHPLITQPLLVLYIMDLCRCNAISGLPCRILTCQYIFRMYKTSGIRFWYRLTQQNAALRTRTHFKTPISNFAVCGSIFKCLTIFRIYRTSGIRFWYRLMQRNAAMRTKTHFKTRISNFAVCGPILKVTKAKLLRRYGFIPGFFFQKDWNLALRTRNHFNSEG